MRTAVMMAVFAALGCALVNGPARGDDGPPSLLRSDALGGEFTGTVAFTTEYFSRGKSNTRPGMPAVQTTLEFNHNSGLYLQVFGSNVDKPPPEDSGKVELDYTAGFRGGISGVDYELFATYVTYPGARHPQGLTFDFVEFTAVAGYDLDVVKPYVAVSWSPDYQYNSETEWYLKTGFEAPIGRYLTALAHVGRSTFGNNGRALSSDYSDWSFGLGTNVLGLDLKLEYVATDLPKSQCVSTCDRVVLTVSKTF